MTLLRTLLLLTLCFCSSVFAASLNGTWQGELLGQPLVLTLGANGQGLLDDAPIRYQIMGNTLLIDDAGEVNAYQFRQQGDTLVVTGGDLPGAVTLTRGKGKTAKTESAAAGKNAQIGHPTRIVQEGAPPRIAGSIGVTNNLAEVVDRGRCALSAA